MSGLVAWPDTLAVPACLNELVCDALGRPQDYRIIDVNPRFESMTGLSREKAAGRLASELYGPTPESALAGFAQATAAGTTVSLDTCLGRRDCRVTALPAGQGRFVTVFAEREAEPEEHGRSLDYREFFDLAPDYCYVVSAEGRLTDVNRAACAALGRTRDELVGSPVLSIYAPEWQARARKLVERWRRTGRLENEEMTIIASDGTRRVVLLSVIAARGERGHLLHSVLVQRDITLLRQAEAALRDSRDSFTDLVGNVGDGVVIADAEENCISANRAAAELFGVTLSELIGHPARRFTTDEGWQRILAETARRRTGEISSYELDIIRPDGETRNTVLSASPRYDVLGRYSGSLAVFHDVTHLRHAEREQARLLRYAACSAREFGCLYAVSELLAASPAPTAAVLAQVADIVPVSWPHGDVSGTVVTAGGIEARSAGFVPTAWNLSAPAQGENGSVGDITVYYRRDRSGTDEPPLPCDERDLLDSIARQLAAFVERRRAEDELRRAHDELEERVRRRTAELEMANKLQHDLVDMVMHDLGTPMQVVSGYSSMMVEGAFGPLTDSQREALEEMQLSVKTLESLRRDMLELSRFESTEVELKLERVDIAELVDGCIHELSFLSSHKKQRVNSFVAPRCVTCDARRIRQVVANYLSNAIRYTQDGGRIEVRSACDDPWLEVSVQDNGRGIEPRDQRHLFEKFRQAGQRVRGSSGMGLAVVKKIVEAHGGRAWCESRPGIGSTFYFRIPTAPASA
ncbi:MAG: PAS domain-containing sensor histidine kinase [bacterium]